MGDIVLQNENTLTNNRVGIPNSNAKTFKNSSNGLKYGLSELSNDKIYLETELPARKRFKLETKFNTKQNKICKLVGDEDKLVNFTNEAHSSEISNILLSEQKFENNSAQTELIKSELNMDIHKQNKPVAVSSHACNSIFQNSFVSNQSNLNSKEFGCNYEKKEDSYDFEFNSGNDLVKNVDKKRSSIQIDIELDDEINKCCELLNLDVPKMVEVKTISTKSITDNFGIKKVSNSQVYKCTIDNNKDQGSDKLYSQSNKLTAKLENISNNEDVKLGAIIVDRNLNVQEFLLNKNKRTCEDSLKLKHKNVSDFSNFASFSNSSSETSNKKCNNRVDTFSHGENNLFVENNSCESKLKYNDKNDLTPKLNNILNSNSSTVRKAINSEKIEKFPDHSDFGHLNLTTENTLKSDTVESYEANDKINFQDNSNDETSSIVSDSGDTLILVDESDIDFEEIGVSEAMHAPMEEINKHASAFYQSLDSKTNKEVLGKEISVLSKTDMLYANDPLDVKSCEKLVLDGVSNNDYIENKDDFKINESFVSEYEISLLIDDTDSLLSEESIDSEYEVSLLEDDINDEEDQDDLHESKLDSNFNSKYSLVDKAEVNEKIEVISQRHLKEPEKEFGNEQTTDDVNLCEIEADKVGLKSERDSKNISENKMPSCLEEGILSDCYSKVINLDMKIPAPKEQTQLISITESSEYMKDNTEYFTTTNEKIILKLKQPLALRSEKVNVLDDDFIKKPLENVEDSHFKIENQQLLNIIEDKNSEEKAEANYECSTDSSCTVKPISQTLVRKELDAVDTCEPKYAKDEYHLSNKVVSNSEINENKSSKETELIVKRDKQLIESTSTDKIEKTNLVVSVSTDVKQDVENKIPDYYEEEKEDLINPGWDKIKELSTDEERYQQVRDCWKSKNIPNPFKNLTYYSYRKYHMNSGEKKAREIKQHKRHASTNLNDNNAKRSRTCTYIFDDRIRCIEKEKETKTEGIQNKMFDEVTRLNEQCLQEEMRIQNSNGYNFDFRWQQFELDNLRRNMEQRISYVTAEYEQQIYNCSHQYTSEIQSLKNNRKEILQFYSFYKGLNPNEYKDPTILTNTQLQELEEIENIYNQMDIHYK